MTLSDWISTLGVPVFLGGAGWIRTISKKVDQHETIIPRIEASLVRVENKLDQLLIQGFERPLASQSAKE